MPSGLILNFGQYVCLLSRAPEMISPQIPLEDMQIISDVFAGLLISDRFGNYQPSARMVQVGIFMLELYQLLITGLTCPIYRKI